MSQRMWMNRWIIVDATNFGKNTLILRIFLSNVTPNNNKHWIRISNKTPPTLSGTFLFFFWLEGATHQTSLPDLPSQMAGESAKNGASDLPMGYFSETPAEATSTWRYETTAFSRWTSTKPGEISPRKLQVRLMVQKSQNNHLRCIQLCK